MDSVERGGSRTGQERSWRRWARLAGAGAIGVAVIAGASGCKSALGSSGSSVTSGSYGGGNGDGSALKALNALPVKPLASKSGYSREQFGQAWTDNVDDPDGHNGCDTRDDILRRDLTDVTLESGSDCTVEKGTLHDPYTGTTLHLTRGVKTSSLVQIDHLVALGDAWQTGAAKLPESTRQDLGNDPLELLAVDGSVNESKGEGDASDWIPANKAFDCRYVALQVAVKTRYHLWVTSGEKAAIAKVLDTCPKESLPAEPGGPGSDSGASGSAAVSPDSGSGTSGPGSSSSSGGSPSSSSSHPGSSSSSGGSSSSGSSSGGSSSGGATVHPGAYCSTPGAHGVTSAGTSMECKPDSTGKHDRWKKA